MSAFPSAEQAAIIEHEGGAALVLAPVGAGKTHVMATRLARVLQGGLDPGRALCVTFTSRAAAEMRRRVSQQVGEAARRVTIATFHALCSQVVRGEADLLGIPRDFVIYDEEDSLEILGALTQLRLEKERKGLLRIISEAKSHVAPEHLSLDAHPHLEGLPEHVQAITRRYHDVLRARHALDFGDLILSVRSLLARDEAARGRWARRFAWIQVDEVQDTHVSEYEVIRHLAGLSGNLAFFGDLDQSIYEWRGSDARLVVARFREDFAPVRQFSLTENRRSTRALLEVADRFATTLTDRHTRIHPAPDLPEGSPPLTCCLDDPFQEAHWVATQVARHQARGASTAVLTRTNARCSAVASALAQRGVPHVTAEDLQFFRRPEVKDAMARLRLALNPYDGGALRRLLGSGPQQVDPQALREVSACQSSGLRLADLGRTSTLQAGDPFGAVLDALERGSVAVIDVETTGLSTGNDEVIEVAALRLEAGKTAPRVFHRYLRPAGTVGDSFHIHGLSDDFLQREGDDAARVLDDLATFMAGAHVVGHNVGFDVRMLQGHARRLGVDLPPFRWDDTLEMARRVLTTERYDLQSLGRHLEIPPQPAHQALGDARTTLDLLRALLPGIRAGAEARRQVVLRVRATFEPVARCLDGWRDAVDDTRPPALLARVLDESGLLHPPAAHPSRIDTMLKLQKFFEDRDPSDESPREALESLVHQAALARTVDLLDTADPRVPVLTVHSAKGMEFDVVFVAGASAHEFPGYHAAGDPTRLQEERRLFYVALTRARKELIISSFQVDNGWPRGPSPFIAEAMEPRP